MNHKQINAKKSTHSRILVKLLKTKDNNKIVNAARKKEKNFKKDNACRGMRRKMTDISSETMTARIQWNYIFREERQRLSAPNSICSENTLQNKDTIRQTKAEILCL